MKILVTGGAGFIGTNFIRFVLAEDEDVSITNLDALTYAGNLANLADVEQNPRYTFVKGDIADRDLVKGLFAEKFDAVMNFAAESHVDRSIHDASAFIRTNVGGTEVLLQAAREHGVARFVQVSTDEVYGSAASGEAFTEESRLLPNSPYAASKTAADLLVRSFVKTFGMPAIITRCSNNYGPYQFPEKLIPLFIANALDGKKLPVYGDGQNERDWIHVSDHVKALYRVLKDGADGEVYNIGEGRPLKNIDVVKRLLEALDKGEDLITYVKDRPGHDRRYAIDSSKIRTALGWVPAYDFERGLRETVDWYCANETWWTAVKTGEYRDYYRKQYGEL